MFCQSIQSSHIPTQISDRTRGGSQKAEALESLRVRPHNCAPLQVRFFVLKFYFIFKILCVCPCRLFSAFFSNTNIFCFFTTNISHIFLHTTIFWFLRRKKNSHTHRFDENDDDEGSSRGCGGRRFDDDFGGGRGGFGGGMPRFIS